MNAYGCLYCCLPACQWDYTQPAIGAFEAREIQALYTGTILPKMAAHQQVLLVPGTFGCTNLSAVGKKAPLQTAQAENVVAKLAHLFEWVRCPCVVRGNLGHQLPLRCFAS